MIFFIAKWLLGCRNTCVKKLEMLFFDKYFIYFLWLARLWHIFWKFEKLIFDCGNWYYFVKFNSRQLFLITFFSRNEFWLGKFALLFFFFWKCMGGQKIKMWKSCLIGALNIQNNEMIPNMASKCESDHIWPLFWPENFRILAKYPI